MIDHKLRDAEPRFQVGLPIYYFTTGVGAAVRSSRNRKLDSPASACDLDPLLFSIRQREHTQLGQVRGAEGVKQFVADLPLSSFLSATGTPVHGRQPEVTIHLLRIRKIM